MSKIVTTRYEYATYDDAAAGSNLTGSPPTYPPTLDQYSSGNIGSTGAGYGVANVNSTGTAQTPMVPATASMILAAATANTTAICATLNAATVPGGTAGSISVVAGPGQFVSIPGSWAGGGVTISTCNGAGIATTAIPFAAQILWRF